MITQPTERRTCASAWRVEARWLMAAAVLAAPHPTLAADFPVDELLGAIRTQSVHRNLVAWDRVESDIRARVAGATTDEERANAFVELFATMDDVHSVLQVGGRSYAHYDGLDEEARRQLLPLLERARAQTGKPVATLVDGRFGYVLVPTMPANTAEEIEAHTRELRGQLSELTKKRPEGWIVDLRLNGGGNVYPMLVGLFLLLGEGVVGGTVDANGVLVHEWVLKKDGLYWRDRGDDRRFAALDPPARWSDPAAPVVVLVGPLTRSSGQAVALAFKGRRRCLLLGEPTAKGYTTVTKPMSFGPDVALILAVGFMIDRKGTAYPSVVLPAETVEGGDAFDALRDDRKVLAAISWLDDRPRRRR